MERIKTVEPKFKSNRKNKRSHNLELYQTPTCFLLSMVTPVVC